MEKLGIGQIAFEAYNESKGGVTYDGKPIPPWSDVGDAVRAGWEAAASAVAAHLSEPFAEVFDAAHDVCVDDDNDDVSGDTIQSLRDAMAGMPVRRQKGGAWS